MAQVPQAGEPPKPEEDEGQDTVTPLYKSDNFFDFHGEGDTDIWGPGFTRTLRKNRCADS